jgi:hypothetical protein
MQITGLIRALDLPNPQADWTVVLRYNVVAPHDQWDPLAIRIQLSDYEI